MGVHDLERVVGTKRRRPGEHLVEHRPERIEIAARVDGPVGAPELLGRCIRKRGRLIVSRFRCTGSVRGRRRAGRCPVEVDQRGRARRVEYDVRGVDVAVDDVALVDPRQDLGESGREFEETVHVERAARPLPKRRGPRVLEDQHRRVANVPERDEFLHARRVARRVDAPEDRRFVDERGKGRRVAMVRLDRLFDERAPLRPERPCHQEPAPPVNLSRLRQSAVLYGRPLHPKACEKARPAPKASRLGSVVAHAARRSSTLAAGALACAAGGRRLKGRPSRDEPELASLDSAAPATTSSRLRRPATFQGLAGTKREEHTALGSGA
jgi:hypothetical protein